MIDPTPVRACLCYPQSFEELCVMARQHGWTRVEDITDALGCGGGCGLCRPYLARMLATGATAFAVIDAEEEAAPATFPPASS